MGEDMSVAADEIAELKRELRGISASVHEEREYSSSLRTQLASMRDAHELDVQFRVQQVTVECEELTRQLEDAAAQLRLRDDVDAVRPLRPVHRSHVAVLAQSLQTSACRPYPREGRHP